MSKFKELEDKAKALEAKDQAAAQSWVKANRGWLIAVAVAFMLGLIIPHL